MVLNMIKIGTGVNAISGRITMWIKLAFPS
jgi:hypothetical protein